MPESQNPLGENEDQSTTNETDGSGISDDELGAEGNPGEHVLELLHSLRGTRPFQNGDPNNNSGQLIKILKEMEVATGDEENQLTSEVDAETEENNDVSDDTKGNTLPKADEAKFAEQNGTMPEYPTTRPITALSTDSLRPLVQYGKKKE